MVPESLVNLADDVAELFLLIFCRKCTVGFWKSENRIRVNRFANMGVTFSLANFDHFDLALETESRTTVIGLQHIGQGGEEVVRLMDLLILIAGSL